MQDQGHGPGRRQRREANREGSRTTRAGAAGRARRMKMGPGPSPVSPHIFSKNSEGPVFASGSHRAPDGSVPSEVIHLLILTARTAKTGCGLRVVASYPGSLMAMTDPRGDMIGCSMDKADVRGCTACEALR